MSVSRDQLRGTNDQGSNESHCRLLAIDESVSTYDKLLLDQGKRCGTGYRVRRVRSKGAVLVLLWIVAVSLIVGAFPSTLLASLPMFKDYDFALTSVQYVVVMLYSPVAGLLGDFYFGRHKFLHYNTLLVWVGSVVSVGALLVEYIFPSTVTALNYSILVPACVVALTGIAGVQVVSIPFGVDQMPDGSTGEISAFIHWLVWAIFLGQFIGSLGSCVFNSSQYGSGALLILGLFAVLSASFVLCTNYLFKGWFVFEPLCQNPVKSITSVLKYALTHKRPVKRSAFTYWEDKIPSRMDLGKMKYGGPFTNEQVEDVKTLFRIAIVTVCILAFAIPAEATFVAVSPYHYKYFHFSTSCYGSITLCVFVVAVVCIPLYELIVYPLARNWIPSSLKRVVFFTFPTIAVSIYLMMLDIVGQSQAAVTVPCMFQANESTPQLPIHYAAVVVPVAILVGIQFIAFNAAALEFIFAQSPYNMKGLLSGFVIMVTNMASYLGDTFYFVWKHNWKDSSVGISCGTWYYLFTMLIGFVGLVLLVVVVRWYKERERDDIVNEQRFAEEYYTNSRNEY